MSERYSRPPSITQNRFRRSGAAGDRCVASRVDQIANCPHAINDAERHRRRAPQAFVNVGEIVLRHE
jgi:hypothetical protein